MVGMEGHHRIHSHVHRHLHGRGKQLDSTLPRVLIEPPLEMERLATTTAPTTVSKTYSGLFRRASCAPDDTSSLCEKPAASINLTIPITIAIVVPIVIGLCVLFFLHRKTAKRHKKEDEDFKSMDFGLGDNVGGKGAKRKSTFFGGEKEVGHNKAMSMDMNLSSPYLLPPELQESRESLHSLARTLHQNEDPYRSVGKIIGNDASSLRSVPRGTDGASSIYTGRTYNSNGRDSPRVRSIGNMPSRHSSLTPAALPSMPPPVQEPLRFDIPEAVPPHSAPPARNEFRFTDEEPPLPLVPNANLQQEYSSHSPEHVSMPAMPEIEEPAPVALKGLARSPRPVSPLSVAGGKPEESYVGGLVGDRDSSALPAADMPRVTPGGPSDAYQTAQQLPPPMSPPTSKTLPTTPRPGRKDSVPIISEVPSEYSDYANHFEFDLQDQDQHGNDERGRQVNVQSGDYEQEYPHSAGLGVPHQDNKRLSVGFRPLPPDEYFESEDPEYRANRIRSFYKEYFDDGTEQRPPMPQPQPQQAQYYEDYDSSYMGEAAYFDPDSNAFVMPYAQPVTRRAMTPPPNNRRGMPGPRQRGPPGSYGMQMPPRGPMGPGPGRSRAASTMSAGQYGSASPRPGSSASARMGRSPGPRKPMPPPSTLNTLPTPSKLRDDSFALMGAIDFAPPPTFKDQARGRSQSPLGERRPYQLNVPISSPLVSAFDDIPSLPSPHTLRKSGTFTGLDFAPPRRFKDPDTMSDSGSIRSVGSGISARNLGAIRNGAGRVSRLPGDQVFTQAAMADTLKPKWSVRD